MKKNALIIGFGIDQKRTEAVSINTLKHISLLEKIGCKVYLYNIGYKNPYFDTGKGFFQSIIKKNKILLDLKSFIKDKNITHILDIFVLPLSSLLFTMPLKKHNEKVIFIKELHNDAGFSKKIHPETLIRLIANNKIILNKILKFFDRIFTKNIGLSKKYKINYIPTFIKSHTKKRIKNKKINICYLGHPLKKKGVPEFSKLFTILPKELRSKVVFNFSFSDVGPREKIVESLAKLAADNDITANFYERMKPHQFFRKNDIYILPIHDHFGAVSTPNTILEAMEASCLVIVHKIESLKGMLSSKEVVYLKSYKADCILKTLIDTIGSMEKQKVRVKKARKKIIDEYSEKSIINLIKKIYE